MIMKDSQLCSWAVDQLTHIEHTKDNGCPSLSSYWWKQNPLSHCKTLLINVGKLSIYQENKRKQCTPQCLVGARMASADSHKQNKSGQCWSSPSWIFCVITISVPFNGLWAPPLLGGWFGPHVDEREGAKLRWTDRLQYDYSSLQAGTTQLRWESM